MAEPLHILLVEDTPSDAFLIRTILLNNPELFSLKHAARLCEAVAHLTTSPVDVILLDLNLPDSTGIDTVRSLRRQVPGIPFVVLTGSDEEEIGLGAIREGAQDFLVKGQTDAALLTRTLRHAVERHSVTGNLREGEALCRNLYETVDQGVLYQSCDGTIFSANPAAERILGRTLKEMAGETSFSPAWNVLPENGIPLPEDDLPAMTAMRTGRRVAGRVLSVFNPVQKEYRRLLVSAVPEFAPNATAPFRIVTTFLDITEKLNTIDALRSAQETAEAARQVKAEFLANMGHEFRTPLNGVLEMLQLLEGTALDAEQQKFLVMCRESCSRLQTLLSDILDLARLETGSMKLRPGPMDIRDTISAICSLYTPACSEKGLTFSCRVDDSVPERLIGDATRLHQVLSNLVGNAFKFTPKGSVEVQVTTLTGRDPSLHRILFTITDTGIGIPEPGLEAIFHAFTQGNGSLSRTHQGAGLGLTIVRNLIKMMNGSLNIESEPGQGTTVYFTLTLAGR